MTSAPEQHNTTAPQSVSLSASGVQAMSGAASIAEQARAVLRPEVLNAPATMAVPVRRIATFHAHNLERLIISLPALMALREAFPGAHISSWVHPSLAPVLQMCPVVDDVSPRPRGRLPAHAALLSKLRSGSYDMAFSFSQGANAILLAWATGASVRVGYSPSSMDALLSHRVPRGNSFSIGTALELVKEVGCTHLDYDLRGTLRIPAQTLLRADRLLNSKDVPASYVIVMVESTKRSDIAKANLKRNCEYPTEWRHDLLRELSQWWPLVVVEEGRAQQIVPYEFEMREKRDKAPIAIGEIGTTHPIFCVGSRLDSAMLVSLFARSRAVLGTAGAGLYLAAAFQKPFVRIPCLGQEAEAETLSIPPYLEYRDVRGDDENEPVGVETVAQVARETFGL